MFLSDQKLHLWALWMMGALQFFHGDWQVESLEELCREVGRRGLAPKCCEFMPGQEVLLGFLDLHSNQYAPPPSCTPGLSHEHSIFDLTLEDIRQHLAHGAGMASWGWTA